ncbi:MAG: phage BR0599 family protein, partial [Loktanella sp.]|nr:phage BR0599 family protein [Loktanella sp.]
CDKRAENCRVKFDNLVNFQGFPDIPGEDWLMSVPRSDDDETGGSLVR